METNNLTSTQLSALAEERKQEEDNLGVPEVVLPNNSTVNNTMIDLAGYYLQDSIEGKEMDTQYAYELLMKSVYGDDIFEYINNL